MDSIVTERVSSNKRIVDMFGYTGVALIAEAFSNGDIEDDVVGLSDRDAGFDPTAEPELIPRNNFTGSQKLKLALDMVKPVAALHNFKDGVIIHDDIQLSQFLWTDETKTAVKLNDFNRAEVMFWDEDHEEYCKYRNGKGHGDVSDTLALNAVCLGCAFGFSRLSSSHFLNWHSGDLPRSTETIPSMRKSIFGA